MADYSRLEAIQNENARWAETFNDSSTNLSQRMRYAQDIAQGKKNEEAATDRNFDRALAGNSGLRDLYFKRQNTELDLRKANLAEERLRFDERKRIFDEDMKLRSEELNIKKANAQMEKAKWELDVAHKIQDQTDNVDRDIAVLTGGGFQPGSPEFAAGLLASVARNPFIDKTTRDTYLKAAHIDDDPDALIGHMRQSGLELSGAALGADGKMRFTFKAPGATKTVPEKADPNIAKMEDMKDQLAKKQGEEAMQARIGERAKAIRQNQVKAQQGEPRVVDRALKDELLKETGGDKEKARALARERGYTF